MFFLLYMFTAERKGANLSVKDTVVSYLAQKYCKDEFEPVVPGSNKTKTFDGAGISDWFFTDYNS